MGKSRRVGRAVGLRWWWLFALCAACVDPSVGARRELAVGPPPPPVAPPGTAICEEGFEPNGTSKTMTCSYAGSRVKQIVVSKAECTPYQIQINGEPATVYSCTCELAIQCEPMSHQQNTFCAAGSFGAQPSPVCPEGELDVRWWSGGNANAEELGMNDNGAPIPPDPRTICIEAFDLEHPPAANNANEFCAINPAPQDTVYTHPCCVKTEGDDDDESGDDDNDEIVIGTLDGGLDEVHLLEVQWLEEFQILGDLSVE